MKGFPGGTSSKNALCQCRRPELWVQSLGQEDPWRRSTANHSVFLSRESVDERPGKLVHGVTKSRYDQ